MKCKCCDEDLCMFVDMHNIKFYFDKDKPKEYVCWPCINTNKRLKLVRKFYAGELKF